MAKSMILLAALLASPAAAVAPKAQKAHLLAHSGRTLETMPMVMFESDCNANSALNKQLKAKKAAFLQNEIPGAGLEKFTPFEKVLKDGFYLVDCVKDSLREFGDKHGNGHQSYNMGDISNVSIVHYTEVVPKEDQKPMSHEVCFSFCRTVPDMLFFGIHNGRDCYCAPYYDAMESDSTECDAVCEGSPATMCGGKVKSSMFGMHSCANMAEKLSDLGGKAEEVADALHDDLDELGEISEEMQKSAASLQETFGQGGDPAASNLMQAAKQYAGEIEKFNKALNATSVALDEAVKDGMKFDDSDFSDFKTAEKADAALAALKSTTAAGEDSATEAQAMIQASMPEVDREKRGAKAQYYPLMYFVDKELEKVSTTCDGDAVGKPMTSLSSDDCAATCDANIHTCTAYSFYPKGRGLESLCFLFSKLKTATVFTGCGIPKEVQQQQQQQQFLQKRADKGKELPMCMLKLSEYADTNISPDSDRAKSGKCPGCLKELTKADRCPLKDF